MAVGTALAIGSLIAGTVMSARSQVKAGNDQKKIADFNAGVAEQQAVDATRRGEEEVSAFRRQVRGLIGTQRAGFSGQHVDVDVGSAVDVRQDAERLGASDMERIRRNAEREAQGYKTQAENARRGGQIAKSAGRWGAASTLLGGAGSLLLDRYGWGTTQVPNKGVA
ncbi:MAG TPA: hypothetical protein VGR82_17595 [Methylomirabilota bacterium]|jgi:hypothetical protein|nr:hypothetical protein [Methylomirabilota bacterium]